MNENISYSKALEILLEIGRRAQKQNLIEKESVAIDFAPFRITAEDIFCKEAVPSFDNSSMDGFAVSSEAVKSATQGSPVSLSVKSLIAAGDGLITENDANCAYEIMTGAAMPKGALDAVVKIEDVIVKRDEEGKALEVRILAPAEKNQFVRFKGQDFKGNEKLLARSQMILPEYLMPLAAQGVSQISVQKKVRVALIQTGRELIDASVESAPAGKIRNSTAAFLRASLPQYGVEVVDFGIVADEVNEFEHKVNLALEQGCEVILTTGAVSMGQHDFVPSVLSKMGGEIYFHRVNIRPGKPILFGELGKQEKTYFFGFPGNPISTAVGLRFFFTPFLREWLEQPKEKPFQAVLSENCEKPSGLKCFFKARTDFSLENVKVEATQGQASFRVSPLLGANSWVVLNEEGTECKRGERVDVYPLMPLEALLLPQERLNGESHGKHCC